jgi:hypothetical protein
VRFSAFGGSPRTADAVSAVKGYKVQSELVLKHLEPLLVDLLSQGKSAIVEGVHLSLNHVARLVTRHRSVVPFLITISNEAKHRERFAVRARHMSLAPEANRYVRYFRQIRAIQEYLVGRAARHSIPRLNNTNVDRSVDVIHACAFAFVRHETQGGVDGNTQLLLGEYNALLTARGAWSSKSMLAVIRSRRSTDCSSVVSSAGGGANCVANNDKVSTDNTIDKDGWLHTGKIIDDLTTANFFHPLTHTA